MQDQCGNEIEILSFPKRIICLVPSLTEFFCAIGLEENLVGITKFCIHPQYLRKEKSIIGGTKNLNLDLIRDLNPDLIIANKEENVKEQIEALKKDFTVYISDINSIEDTCVFIKDMAEIFQKKAECEKILNEIEAEFNSVEYTKKKVLYLIWNKPYMAAAHNTFINDVLEKVGFENALSKEYSRYPELNKEEISKLDVDYVFLSSEPFPYTEKHIEEWERLVPQAKVKLVDGELFSWYGIRFIGIKKYVAQVLL